MEVLNYTLKLLPMAEKLSRIETFENKGKEKIQINTGVEDCVRKSHVILEQNNKVMLFWNTVRNNERGSSAN